MTDPRTLRIALQLAKASEVTSSTLAVAAGITVERASDRLGRFRERGLLRIVSGAGLRHNPFRYALTLTGASHLERMGKPGAKPAPEPEADFGPLLACWGISNRGC